MAKLKIENRFGITPNHVLTSRMLSWKAKGLYGYIQSKPEDWDFAIERFEGKDGRDGVRAGVEELENYGVLIRERIRLKNGTYDMEYTLLDTPRINTNHDGKSVVATMTENPTEENPTEENPSYNKKRNTKKEIQKKSSLLFEEFWSLYPKKQSRSTAEKSFAKLSPEEQRTSIDILPAHIRFWTLKNGKDTSFVPMGSTWLNQKRFEDVLNFEEVSQRSAAGFSELSKELRKKGEQDAERLRKMEEEMEVKAKKIAHEHQQKMLKFFVSLSLETRAKYIQMAEDKLPAAIMKSKDKFPEQFKHLKFAKIMQLLREDKANFSNYPE